MTPSNDREVPKAYSRASVEAYLRAASAERKRLEAAIADVRQRTERALLVEQTLALDEVGQAVGDPYDESGLSPASPSMADPLGDDVQLLSPSAAGEPLVNQLRFVLLDSEDVGLGSVLPTTAMAHE
jgi:hypothetical protein